MDADGDRRHPIQLPECRHRSGRIAGRPADDRACRVADTEQGGSAGPGCQCRQPGQRQLRPVSDPAAVQGRLRALRRTDRDGRRLPAVVRVQERGRRAERPADQRHRQGRPGGRRLRHDVRGGVGRGREPIRQHRSGPGSGRTWWHRVRRARVEHGRPHGVADRVADAAIPRQLHTAAIRQHLWRLDHQEGGERHDRHHGGRQHEGGAVGPPHRGGCVRRGARAGAGGAGGPSQPGRVRRRRVGHGHPVLLRHGRTAEEAVPLHHDVADGFRSGARVLTLDHGQPGQGGQCVAGRMRGVSRARWLADGGRQHLPRGRIAGPDVLRLLRRHRLVLSPGAGRRKRRAGRRAAGQLSCGKLLRRGSRRHDSVHQRRRQL